METILIDLTHIVESDNEELNAYRKLGSVKRLSRMKQREAERRCRIKLFKKIATNLLVAASIVFIIWVFASWMDIAFHNLDTNPVYHAWNLFA